MTAIDFDIDDVESTTTETPGRRFGYVIEALVIVTSILALWFVATVFMRATNNWLDGYGFTPKTHITPMVVGEIAPGIPPIGQVGP